MIRRLPHSPSLPSAAAWIAAVLLGHAAGAARAQVLVAEDDTFGARLTGAGFGGAYVALVKAGAASVVAAGALAAYADAGYHGRVLVGGAPERGSGGEAGRLPPHEGRSPGAD